MSDIVLHPKTKQSIEQAIQRATHGLLLTGERGAGKYTVATHIVSQHLGMPIRTAPYLLIVQSNGKAIGIEQIRELQKFLQLKTAGKDAIRRAVIIDDADTMTVEAQNALLKILEEPPEDTVLVLTASRPHQLRPTIHSRVQAISVLPPTKADVMDVFLNQGFGRTDIDRAYVLSNGQVGLLTALLQSDGDNTLVQQIDYAKRLYGMSSFDRLAKIDELSKDKDALRELLFACKRICISALEQAALKSQQKAVQTWHKQLGLILKTEESLKNNPNTKLLLTDLFINM
jgi:DNA polymerase-3 subunit delta'